MLYTACYGMYTSSNICDLLHACFLFFLFHLHYALGESFSTSGLGNDFFAGYQGFCTSQGCLAHYKALHELGQLS